MFKTFATLGASALLMLSSAAWSHDDAHPTDAEIAHIAYTAGQIDVDAGKLALTKSQDAAVRDFATTMVRDHAAVNEQALALVKKLGVTPAANDISAGLAKQAAEQASKLSALNGDAFDRAYVANEIAYHRTVNAALRDALIPNADNAELKVLLETGLALFEEHQSHAEHLAQAIE